MLRRIMSLTFIILFTVFFCAVENGFSQENTVNGNKQVQTDTNSDNSGTSLFQEGDLSTDVNPFWTPEETFLKKGLRYSILVGVPVVHLVYGLTVWDWGTSSPHSASERWFQGDTDSGGADKTGHFFAHYMVSRATYSIFSYTENSQNRALAYSAFTAALIGTMIEIGDAYTGRYGFSREDLIVDYLGVAVAFVLDKYPLMDSFIGVTAHYWPSDGFKEDDDKTWANFAGDYSGWKYLTSFKLAGFKYMGYNIPEFMRYIQFDLGYFTRDYTEYDAGIEPRREWFFGASVNMREVAKDLFASNKKAAWLAEQPFKYYHVPLGYYNNNTLPLSQNAGNGKR